MKQYQIPTHTGKNFHSIAIENKILFDKITTAVFNQFGIKIHTVASQISDTRFCYPVLIESNKAIKKATLQSIADFIAGFIYCNRMG